MAYSENLGSRDRDVVSQDDGNAENETIGSSRAPGLNPKGDSDQAEDDAGKGKGEPFVSLDFQGSGVLSPFSHLFHFVFDLVEGHLFIF